MIALEKRMQVNILDGTIIAVVCKH